jgi:hypothetical protein
MKHRQARTKDNKLQAHEELATQLEHRMNLLIQEGGDVKGLPDDWRALPSDTLSEMLKETERAYRSLLFDKIVFFGAWIDQGTSINHLEQFLNSLRDCATSS